VTCPIGGASPFRCGQAQCEGRQPESSLLAEPSQPQQCVVVETGLAGKAAHIAQDLCFGEHLVAGGHRRVCGEDRRPTHLFDRVRRRHPVGAERTDALERQERRVALVHVEDGRLDAERRQRAATPHAEQELLPHTVLAIAAVKGVGEPVDLEQVERHRADVLPPDVRADVPAGEIELHRDRLAHETARSGVDRHVVLGLGAGRVEALLEVAPTVEETDADERDAELGRALQVIAGEHTEPAGVDRQALVDAELHREVCDEEIPTRLAMNLLPPGARESRRNG
jgi:hypothetical protein